MLHDLFTISVNGRRQGGWILLLPTVSNFLETNIKISWYLGTLIHIYIWLLNRLQYKWQGHEKNVTKADAISCRLPPGGVMYGFALKLPCAYINDIKSRIYVGNHSTERR